MANGFETRRARTAWSAIACVLAALAALAAAGPARARPPAVADPGDALAACAPPCRIALDGTWRFQPGNLAPADQHAPGKDDSGWARIEVPSNWYLQGHDHAGAAWYRRRFVAPAGVSGKTLRLVFHGVDYAADVWLNGVYLGFHEGYFQPFGFDVSKLVRPGAPNLLAVRVDSPTEEPRAWSLRKRLIKGVFAHHDARPGGAWSPRGQDGNTGGIWDSVELRVSEGAAIEALRVTPRIGGNGRAQDGRDAQAAVDVRLARTDGRAEPLDVEVSIEPKNFSGPAVRQVRRIAGAGPRQAAWAVSVPDARLWWPAGHGAPNLYRLTVSVRRDGRLVERAERTFGFRSVGYDPAEGIWRINGRAVFLRGTNYIPTQWLSEMTRQSYQRDARLMLDAHVNAVRVHGHVGARAFYEVCDEAGLLVWQDYPLQWGYQDTPELHREARRQALDMVELLHAHPSIIAWSLHNEPPWDAPWMKDRYADYDPGQNAALDELLWRTVRQADTTRHVHKFSGTAEHPWLGWYSGHWTDFAGPTRQALITEFGAQALPGVASLRRFLTDEQLWPDSPADWDAWAYRNFQRHETFELARVPMGRDIDEMVRNTQAYQARLTQLAVESYRRQKYRPVGAIFQFMFSESWPSMNWGVVDYWRQPKQGYEALKAAYQPVLPSIEWSRDRFASDEPVRLGLWVVNDSWQRLPAARYGFVLRSRDGAELLAQEHDVDIEPDSARKLMDLPAVQLAPGEYELEATIRAAGGAHAARNRFVFKVDGAGSTGRP